VRGAVAWPREAAAEAKTDREASTSPQASAAPAPPPVQPALQPDKAGNSNVSDRFSAQDEAALKAWAMAVKAPPHPALPAKPSPPLPLNLPPSLAAADVSALALTAKAQLGKRYVMGGESPRQGFDCSGLTSYVYARSGVELSRNSREQFRQGQAVKRENLRQGDLVFFGKKGVHHVGIYMGDGKFVHAASSGGAVTTGSLDDPVWSSSYAGARRVLRDDSELSAKGANLSATG
jgi:cell wall-associated NlpC family hydrolase